MSGRWRNITNYILNTQDQLLPCYSCVIPAPPSSCCLSRCHVGAGGLARCEPSRSRKQHINHTCLTLPRPNSICLSDPAWGEGFMGTPWKERALWSGFITLDIKNCSFVSGLEDMHSLSTAVHGKTYLKNVWMVFTERTCWKTTLLISVS